MIKLNNGRCILMHGDNAKLFKSIKNDYIDLTITSPPYDNLRNYNGFHFNFENTANELYRVTKIGGIIVWVVADKTHNGSESGTSFTQALYFKSIGFNLHDTMIYKKATAIPRNTNRYEPIFEYMFVFSKHYVATFNPIMVDAIGSGKKITGTLRKNVQGDMLYKSGWGNMGCSQKVKSNIWEFPNIGRPKDHERYIYKHPATFPEKLAEDHILSWSNPNDIVLDPMMGSGTTGKMATLHNRKFIGMECSEEYFNIAAQRISQAIKDHDQVAV